MHQRSEPEEKTFSCTFSLIKDRSHQKKLKMSALFWKQYAQRKFQNEYDKDIMPL
jgi:hypothetical protein